MKKMLGKKVCHAKVNMQIMRGCPCITVCQSTKQNSVADLVASWTFV